MCKIALALFVIPFLLSNTSAQSTEKVERANPYSCLGAASNKNLDEMREKVKALLSAQNNTALSYCEIAELMKRLGSYEAEKYYRKAIKTDDSEPAYEVFFADYLRNFRGALHPLFPEAEAHYFEAQRKLNEIKDKKDFDEHTKMRLERGLVALYQEDGLPLAHWSSASLDRPFWFFASINKYSNMLGDFDRVDEVRSLTSEALFASSRFKLNRPLTEDELSKLIRTKPQYETLNRFRFRYMEMPVIDIFYKYRAVEDAQITNFFDPNKFNDVRLNEYGIAVEKSVNVASRLTYSFAAQ